MLRTILSISGKPGLYRLVSQGRNMLVVESLTDGKRIPAYSRDKVMSLGDIAMYTYGDDVPLADVLEALKEKTDGKQVDIKEFKDTPALFEFFGEVLKDFDRERVHSSDVRKLIQWYNLLISAGITEFKEAAEATDSPEADSAEQPEEASEEEKSEK